MRFIRALICLAFFSNSLGIAAGGANARPYASWADSHDMAENCRVSNLGAGDYCRGFVVAIAEVLGRDSAIKNDNRLCIPTGTTAEQLRLVASKYFDKHPENWNLPAAILVESALQDSFPCIGKPVK